MNYVEVLKTSQISDGSLRTVEVEGRVLAVAQIGDKFFAFDDTCTHKQCSLSEGFLDGTTVECPCHGARFDVTSGVVLNLPAVLPIKTYPVRVAGKRILIQV